MTMKIKLPKDVADEMLEAKEKNEFFDLYIQRVIGTPHWYPYSSKYWYSNDGNNTEILLNAWDNGYTVEKPKRCVLPMPGTGYHNYQMHGNAQYYAVKRIGNWRPDAIALGTDDAVKHGYTVTQSDIYAAPDWVKAITPVEVTDDDIKK